MGGVSRGQLGQTQATLPPSCVSSFICTFHLACWCKGGGRRVVLHTLSAWSPTHHELTGCNSLPLSKHTLLQHASAVAACKHCNTQLLQHACRHTGQLSDCRQGITQPAANKTHKPSSTPTPWTTALHAMLRLHQNLTPCLLPAALTNVYTTPHQDKPLMHCAHPPLLQCQRCPATAAGHVLGHESLRPTCPRGAASRPCTGCCTSFPCGRVVGARCWPRWRQP